MSYGTSFVTMLIGLTSYFTFTLSGGGNGGAIT